VSVRDADGALIVSRAAGGRLGSLPIEGADGLEVVPAGDVRLRRC
jgi:hypothetical protein